MFKVLKRVLSEYSYDEKGNASIEYILIISMIVIIAFTIVSFSATLKNQFNTSTCNINCKIAETEYKSYLSKNGVAHSELVYLQFINEYGQEICPENKAISYINGELQCNGHNKGIYADDNDDDQDQDETVPFL